MPKRGYSVTELPAPTLRREDVYIRAFAITAAGFLLNIGLFFILGILTSLTVGLIVGYIIGEKWTSPIGGSLSAMIAYSIMFPITNISAEIIIVLEAIGIMVVLGFIGGYFGEYIRKRTTG